MPRRSRTTTTYLTVDFFVKRAEMEAYLERYEDAMNDYIQAINIAPSDAILYQGRANISFRLGNWNDAISDYSRYLNSNESYIAYGNRGYCYFMQEDYEKAMKDLDKCIELNPEYAWAYFTRGQIKTALEDFEGARDDFDKASELTGE